MSELILLADIEDDIISHRGVQPDQRSFYELTDLIGRKPGGVNDSPGRVAVMICFNNEAPVLFSD